MTGLQELREQAEFHNTEKAAGTAITVQSQVTPRRTIIMQTAIARDLPARDFHELVDKYAAVLDRQEAKSDLATLKLHIERATIDLKAAERDYAAIDIRNAEVWKARGKAGEPKLSATEQTSKVNVANNIKAGRENIEKMHRELKELEAQIAKVD